MARILSAGAAAGEAAARNASIWADKRGGVRFVELARIDGFAQSLGGQGAGREGQGADQEDDGQMFHGDLGRCCESE